MTPREGGRPLELPDALSAMVPLPGDAFRERLRTIAALVAPSSMVEGWASVDIERSEAELVERFGEGASGAAAADRPRGEDPLLGASCRLLALGGGRRIVILEPNKEGPLAAALARFGEGTLALYLVVDAAAVESARRAGLHFSTEADGPLGRQRLVAGGPRWGPHVLLVGDDGAGDAAGLEVGAAGSACRHRLPSPGDRGGEHRAPSGDA